MDTAELLGFQGHPPRAASNASVLFSIDRPSRSDRCLEGRALHLIGPCAIGISIFLTSLASGQVPNRVSVAALDDLATEITGDASITAVCPVGDVDQDGLEDVVIRFSQAEVIPPLSYDHVVLLYGSSQPGRTLNVSDASVRKTVVRTLATEPTADRDTAGPIAVAGGHDVNGDSIPDLAVASLYEEAVQGPAVLLIHGGSLPMVMDGSLLGQGIEGSFIFYDGPSFGEAFGAFVVLTEDLNGDDLGEVVVWSRVGGKVFVLFGRSSLPLKMNAAEAGDGLPGFSFETSMGTLVNRVGSIGDVDGDGLADLGIAGTGRVDPISFVVFGRRSFPSVLSQGGSPEEIGLTLPGVSEVASAGDVGGDGPTDLLLEVRDESPGVPARAILIDGRVRAQWPSMVDVDMLGGLGPRAVIQEPPDNRSGLATRSLDLSLTDARDVDGDGKPETLLGAPGRTMTDGPVAALFAGAAYLIRGDPPMAGEVIGFEAAGRNGAEIDGLEPHGEFGSVGFLLSDSTGDGVGDILLVSRKDACLAPELARFTLKLWLISGHVLDSIQPPRLGRILPEQASAGESVLILGTGFDAASRVFFNGEVSPSVEVLGSGVALAVAPDSTGSKVDVRAETILGSATIAQGFEYETTPSLMLEAGSARAFEMRWSQLDPLGLEGASVGDFNGDTKPDIALLRSLSQGLAGEIYVVFGDGTRRQNLILDAIDLPDVMNLPLGVDRSGFRLSSGGDINADRMDDLVLGIVTRSDGGRPKYEWLVIPGRDAFPSGTPLENLPRTTRIFKSSQDLDAGAAAIVPDVSGDGVDDLLLTSEMPGPWTFLYIVEGSGDGLAEVIDLDTLAESGLGTRLEVDLSVGRFVGPLGDFNGDGIDDFFFGGAGAIQEGALIIVYGNPGFFTGRALTLNNGFFGDYGGLLVVGARLVGGTISSAAGPGDLDGDGDMDIFFYLDDSDACSLAPRAGGGIIFDHAAAISGGIPQEASELVRNFYGNRMTGLPDFVPHPSSSTAGMLFVENTVALEGLGSSAAAGGDFDGDGLPDLLLGGPGVTTLRPIGGIAHMLHGAMDLLDGDIMRLPGEDVRGFRFLTGTEESGLGKFLGGNFDWDRDGFDDVLVASDDGRAYIVFGARDQSLFLRGDVDANDKLELTDSVATLLYLFQSGAEPRCLDAADSNDDGVVNITDPIYSLSHLFLGGPVLPPPFPDRGIDPSDDAMRCTP